MSKKIGIIGGLGPMATVCLMKYLNDDINMFIVNDPTTPDRTKYILDNNNDDPTNNILRMVKKLENEKVDIITMPCNTASYFYDRIKQSIDCEFISIVSETSRYINDLGAKKVGLLATDGTINSNIYKDALSNYDIELIIPSKDNQQHVMRIIYDEIKANKEVSIEELKLVIKELKEIGAQRIILGCTELSIIYEKGLLDDEILVDSIEVLSNVLNKKAKN